MAIHDETQTYFSKLEGLVQEKTWSRLTRQDLVPNAPQVMTPYLAQNDVKQAIFAFVISEGEKSLMDMTAGLRSGVSTKDLLFEGVVTFLDALLSFKPFLKMVYDENPMHLLSRSLLMRLEDVLQIILEQATISTASVKGLMRLKAFNLLFISVFMQWIQDATADQSITLASLDTRLAQAEELAGLLGI